jgi:lipoate-protein ligase B
MVMMSLLSQSGCRPHEGRPPLEAETLGILPRRSAQLWIAGVIPFERAWTLQRQLVKRRLEGHGLDAVMLLEHEPTLTLGRRTRPEHWGGDESAVARAGCALFRIERGGSVTYHGPGQIVGYPILTLRDHCSGPKAYMHKLESVLIRALAAWGIQGFRWAGYPGVWVGDPPAKIAAMGAHIRRGITMHGFALNVCVDLAPFAKIVPCGLDGCRVTSMAEILGHSPSLDEVKARTARVFAQEFSLEWIADRSIEPGDVFDQESRHG